MMNALINLLNDSSLNYLENCLFEGLDRLNKTFKTYFTTLEDKEDHYELVVDVADDAKASNVTVDYDDDTRELNVEYNYKKENYSSRSVISEVLPEDADEETIDATVSDGKLTILISKKVVEEAAEEAVDDTVVKVNRKKK